MQDFPFIFGISYSILEFFAFYYEIVYIFFSLPLIFLIPALQVFISFASDYKSTLLNILYYIE